MNPNQPTPSDLCECGHSRNAHSNGDTLCWSYKCPCTNFKPATPQPEPSNTMNEFEVRAYTDKYLVQQLEKTKVVLGIFEQEYSRRNPQPTPVPVSEADVERVAKDFYDYCFHPPNVWPKTQNYRKFIECARYHLEQIQKYKDEQTQSLIVVDRLCVQRDELKQRVKELEDACSDWENKFLGAVFQLEPIELLRRDNSRLREALFNIQNEILSNTITKISKLDLVLKIATQALSQQPADLPTNKGGDSPCNAPVNCQPDSPVQSTVASSPAPEMTKGAYPDWNDLEGAEHALSEIYVLCGYNDPSEGEGTGYSEVTEAVSNSLKTLRAELTTLKQDKEKLKEALRTHGAHRSNCRCLEPFRNFECSCGLSQVLELTSKTDTQT